MKLIGFTGKMGSGKSTAIQCIKEIQRHPVYTLKFAQPLYDMQDYIYGRIESVHRKPASFIKDRKLLQFLGTDWGRQLISPTLWTDLWKAQAQQILNNNTGLIVVADDIRFDNEAELVRSMGGHIIQVESSKSVERIDTKSGFAGHASESGVSLNNVDYILENNGTIDDLKNSLLTFNAIKALW